MTEAHGSSDQPRHRSGLRPLCGEEGEERSSGWYQKDSWAVILRLFFEGVGNFRVQGLWVESYRVIGLSTLGQIAAVAS